VQLIVLCVLHWEIAQLKKIVVFDDTFIYNFIRGVFFMYSKTVWPRE
jgi:preprotein translocase subunit SecE